MARNRSKRGVLYVVWGKQRSDMIDKALRRSIQTLYQQHPELPVTIKEIAENSTLLDKPVMYELSPYEETLFLDVDTAVLGKLDYGFDCAARHGLACVICESPWARRHQNSITGELTEYNTGVLWFRKDDRNAALFKRWGELAKTMDSSIVFVDMKGRTQKAPLNDQASFAKAVDELGFNPFVLPMNWNYRASFEPFFFGPIRIWHDYGEVPQQLIDFNAAQEKPGAVLDFFKLW